MKLNNRGWGLKEMIIMSSILFVLLLIVAYYVVALYDDLSLNDRKVYTDLETKLQVAAVKYNSLYPEKDVITLSDLQDAQLISDFTDEDNNSCNGYVKVKEYNYDSYIYCKKYKTSGYNKKLA